MPARNTKIRHDEQTRAKIQAAQIINRLHNHLMGKVDLTAAQVSSAKVLLGKVLPDLQAITLEGDVTHYAVATKPLSADEWAAKHASQD